MVQIRNLVASRLNGHRPRANVRNQAKEFSHKVVNENAKLQKKEKLNNTETTFNIFNI